jgi:hypothetical protein
MCSFTDSLMIKKILSILLLLTVLNCYAFCDYSNLSRHWKYFQDTTKKTGPQIVFKMHAKDFHPDSTVLNRIDTAWIKKIEVLKDKKFHNLYDPPNDDAVIIIYFKRKYIKQVEEMVKTKK